MDKKCISNCVDKNNFTLNPINLKLYKNFHNESICITKPYYEKNNKFKYYKLNCKKRKKI